VNADMAALARYSIALLQADAGRVGMRLPLMTQSHTPIKSLCNSDTVLALMRLGMTRLGLVAGCVLAMPAAAAPVHGAAGTGTAGDQPAFQDQLSGFAAGSQSAGTLLRMTLFLGMNLTPTPLPQLPSSDLSDPTGPGDDDWSADDAANSPSAPGLLRGLFPQPTAANRADCTGLAVLSADDRRYWNARVGAPFPGSGTTADMAALADIAPGGAKQVTSAGPMGLWCRPATEPFSASSPLASRSVWTPMFLLTFGIAVFLATRGWRLPP